MLLWQLSIAAFYGVSSRQRCCYDTSSANLQTLAQLILSAILVLNTHFSKSRHSIFPFYSRSSGLEIAYIVIKYGGFNRNGLLRLIHLNVWCCLTGVRKRGPDGVDVALSEEMCPWKMGFEISNALAIECLFLPATYRSEYRTLSYHVSLHATRFPP